MQRRLAAIGESVYVSVVLQEESHHVRMVPLAGGMQRSPLEGGLGVHIGVVLQQKFSHFQVVLVGSAMEGSVQVLIARVHTLGIIFKNLPDCGDVSRLGCVQNKSFRGG